MADENLVRDAASAHGIVIPSDVCFCPPEPNVYAERLAALRAHKNLTVDAAAELLVDPLASAAMMVRTGDADGMVAGAATASSDVLSCALRIVGAAPGITCVSSLFFMVFQDIVRIFSDCALNLDPDAEQLACIAVQSARSAKDFGIVPVVAMLSHVTGSGGKGPSVAKIRRATELARARLRGVPVFGPIQYDAAVSPEIAARKAPGWDNAGQASVLIFPSLDAGNIAYKAVQQTGAVAAVGPVLQGMAAPVNDLSRGASEEDIYYTAAVTAVQVEGG